MAKQQLFHKHFPHIRYRLFTKLQRSVVDAIRHSANRGIDVYESWLQDRKAMLQYIAELPGCGLTATLRRIDAYKGYEPGNLKWA